MNHYPIAVATALLASVSTIANAAPAMTLYPQQMGSRSGLHRGAKRSAALIVKQTRQFYRASGWPWPSDKG